MKWVLTFKLVFLYFTLVKDDKKATAAWIWSWLRKNTDDKTFFILVKYWKKKPNTFQDSYQWNQTGRLVWFGIWDNKEWLKKIKGSYLFNLSHKWPYIPIYGPSKFLSWLRYVNGPKFWWQFMWRLSGFILWESGVEKRNYQIDK